MHGAHAITEVLVICRRPQFHPVGIPSRRLEPPIERTIDRFNVVGLRQQNERRAVAGHDSSSLVSS
jgi:hypothetical protein